MMSVVCMFAVLCSNSVHGSDQIIYLSCFYFLQEFYKTRKKADNQEKHQM